MRKFTIGIISANVVLAGWLAVETTRHKSSPANELASNAATTELSAAVPKVPVRRTSNAQSPQPRFSWEALASADLKKYASNLRAVGCPEETVKDLIMAEINRRFAPREKALKIQPSDYNPWEAPVTSGSAYFERLKQIRNLTAEKKQAIHDALGIDVAVDIPAVLPKGTLSKYDEAYKALPEAKRDATRSIQDSYWDKVDEIRKRTLGYLDATDRDELTKLKNERRDALAKILTPQELLDFDMQTSVAANTVRNRLKGSDASEAEMRELFKRVQPMEQELALMRTTYDPDDASLGQRRAQLDQGIKAQTKEILGDARYAEFERNRDPVYAGFKAAVQQANLPPDSAVKAYDIQRALQDETGKLMANNELSPQERQETLTTMRQQANSVLQQVLGPQAFDAWQRSSAGQRAMNNRLTVPATIKLQGDTIIAPQAIPAAPERLISK